MANINDSTKETGKQASFTPKQAEKVNEFLEKAYTTGHEINPGEQEDGSAIRREFLDDQITMLTWGENDLNFFLEIPRVQSESTVAQYTTFNRHGKVGPSRFVREIDISPVNDPNIVKKNVNMKFVSDTKQLSLASQIVRNTTDPTRFLTNEGIENVAKSIEWGSFYGDADLSDNPEQDSGLQFNGLTKLISPDNVIDARGKELSQELLNQAVINIAKGFGTPTDAFMPVGVHAQFVNSLLNNQVQLMSDNAGNVDAGFSVQGFYSVRGRIKLHGSTVMDLENILDEHYAPVPNAPQPAQVTADVNTNDGGAFREEELKEQNYKVVVHADHSDSAPSQVATAVVSNPTDSIELSINVSGMYGNRPQFVSIYRQEETTGLYYLIDRVGYNKAENGVIVYKDKNANIPGTSDVFVGEMTPSVIHLFELLPMVKIQMAQINASDTFTILWYGALALRAPKRWARIKNVNSVLVSDPHGNNN